jgi:hypothetical protein
LGWAWLGSNGFVKVRYGADAVPKGKISSTAVKICRPSRREFDRAAVFGDSGWLIALIGEVDTADEVRHGKRTAVLKRLLAIFCGSRISSLEPEGHAAVGISDGQVGPGGTYGNGATADGAVHVATRTFEPVAGRFD